MLGEAGAPDRGIWPMTSYPGSGRGGTAEVVFQYLAAREPFTDRTLRADLLERINKGCLTQDAMATVLDVIHTRVSKTLQAS